MRGLRKGDGGGVARLLMHDSTRQGLGKEMGMDGRSHRRGRKGREANVQDGVPQGGEQRSAQSKGAQGGQVRGRRCAYNSVEGTCGTLSSSWRRETPPIQDAKTETCLYRGGPSMAAIRAQ